MRSSDQRYNGYNNGNLDKARSLRKNMTAQEKRLWYDFLKAYPIRFYRQRPIDRYIPDFYSSTAKLAIELDGDQHGEDLAREYDRVRTERLQAFGLEVLRFANEEVDRSFESVCHLINKTVKHRLLILGDSEAVQKLEALEKTWDVYSD